MSKLLQEKHLMARELEADPQGALRAYGDAVKRASVLLRVADKIRSDADHLARMIASEGQKPLRDARVEVQRAARTLELCVHEWRSLEGRELNLGLSSAGQGHLSFTSRRPRGPALLISAFNHPLNLIAHLLGPAVQAGVPCLVKPALEVVGIARWLETALLEAGLHRSWFEILDWPDQELDQIVRSEQLAFLGFVGSARVGWELRAKVAPGCRVALEHGGTAALILDRDADWQSRVGEIVSAATYHAGQVCISTQHLFVHEEIYEGVLKALQEAVSRLVIGPSEDETTQVGPLFRKRDAERVRRWVDEAIAAGAVELVRKAAPAGERYCDVRVLGSVPWNQSLACQEIFGPVLVMHRFSALADVMESLRKLPWRFHLSLWTRQLEAALWAARTAPASHVLINQTTVFRVDEMPFSGLGPSGLGRGGVRGTLEELTEELSVSFRSPDWVR